MRSKKIKVLPREEELFEHHSRVFQNPFFVKTLLRIEPVCKISYQLNTENHNRKHTLFVAGLNKLRGAVL